jgi:hypothetical protein
LIVRVIPRRCRWIFIVEEDPLPGSLEIVELSAPRGPDKCDHTGHGKQQSDREGDVDRGHEGIMAYFLGRRKSVSSSEE